MDERPEELNKIGKKDIFNYPDGYFDSLEQRIASRIDAHEESKIVSLNTSARVKWMAAAAAVIVFLILVVPRMSAPEAQSVHDMLADVPTELCLVYLKESDIDPADFFSVEDLDQLFLEEDGDLIPDNNFYHGDTDLLFEKYGVTDDENLKPL